MCSLSVAPATEEPGHDEGAPQLYCNLGHDEGAPQLYCNLGHGNRTDPIVAGSTIVWV